MTVDALMDAWQDAWSGRDPDAFGRLCAADVHYEDPVCGEPLESADAIGVHAQRLWTAFPDARVEATGPRMVADRHVAAPCKVVATHRGELEGLPPTGRFVVVQVVVVARLHADEDLVWRARSFFDVYDAAVQLGVLPARGTLGEKALMALRGFGMRSR